MNRPLPNPLPRPPGELEELQRIWESPRGIRRLTDVNNTYIGIYYIGTALLFLVLAGILGLIMRTQLAVPENDLVGYNTYNQLFTMHGTVMMFLFAVPVVEALGVYLLPGMLAARDLPFPKLSAYAFWAYAAGGLIFFCTLFFGVAPDGGWFMYPPLTSYTYSPGINADFWLLGIGFIEISAIAGAIELIVGILRTRAPGMSLDKMPIYAWAMLVVGVMIVFGFPPVILGTMLLELERAFHWPFFVAEKGGDPVLWQHLFWLFGHPEVYIIFLPAAGLVSMMIPTLARTPLVGYRWVVLALLGVGVLSFGLWAHHMFTTGMPHRSSAFFAAASMAVAIPSGIQVFSWIATLWRGKPHLTASMWFLLSFLFIFVLGGLTGVMVAMVPFDWQVHDTYFVVAHFHYVLIGGMVFPLCAALYYWAPTVSGKPLSERMGKWACGLMFGGMNLTFFPMHISGLLGMPRRVYTYAEGLGLDPWNLASTIGSYILAVGFVVLFLDVILHLRIAGKVNTNPWKASSLEWLPLDNYAARSIPRIESREPLWDHPGLREEVDQGQHYLPGSLTGKRETIVTSPIEARPQYLLILPGPGWLPFLSGVGTALFFLMLTLKQTLPSVLFGVATVAMILCWLWETDRPPRLPPVDVGDGIKLPIATTGKNSHAWWAVVTLLLVDGTIFASLVFSYFYLWTVTTGSPWPPAGANLPQPATVIASAAALLVSSALVEWGARALKNAHRRLNITLSLVLLIALALLTTAFTLDLFAHLDTGVRPDHHAYGAVVYTMLSYQGMHVVLLVIMTFYTLARAWSGLLDPERRMTFDSTRLIWHYTVGQGVLMILIANIFPRLLA